MQIGKASQGDVKFDLPANHPDYGQDIAATISGYFKYDVQFLSMGIVCQYCDSISTNQTRVIYRGYVKDESLAKQGAGSILDTVEIQDQEIIEQVNKSMRSKVTIEEGIHLRGSKAFTIFTE